MRNAHDVLDARALRVAVRNAQRDAELRLLDAQERSAVRVMNDASAYVHSVTHADELRAATHALRAARVEHARCEQRLHAARARYLAREERDAAQREHAAQRVRDAVERSRAAREAYSTLSVSAHVESMNDSDAALALSQLIVDARALAEYQSTSRCVRALNDALRDALDVRAYALRDAGTRAALAQRNADALAHERSATQYAHARDVERVADDVDAACDAHADTQRALDAASHSVAACVSSVECARELCACDAQCYVVEFLHCDSDAARRVCNAAYALDVERDAHAQELCDVLNTYAVAHVEHTLSDSERDALAHAANESTSVALFVETCARLDADDDARERNAARQRDAGTSSDSEERASAVDARDVASLDNAARCDALRARRRARTQRDSDAQ